MIVELSQSKGNKRCYKRIAICTSVIVTQIHLPPLKRGALHSEALARSHRHTQTLINNWFICQRAFVEIWSTREVWRARKVRKSCSRRSREQLLLLECSPNFPSASYLDERTADVWTNCFITFQPEGKFFSRGICLLTSWACAIGIWSTLAQLNLIRQSY